MFGQINKDGKRVNVFSDDGTVVAALRAAFPQALAIYAFGSRILGTAQVESDLDLAILVDGYAPALQLWEVANQLSGVVGCAVDLLDLRAASTVMQFQVITQGRLLWSKQPNAALFECFVLSEKSNLDAARAGLLNDIATEGKIYGG